MDSPQGAFRRATAAHRVAGSGEAATYRAEVAPGWDILGNANGGYLLALAARILSEHLDRPDPVSLTGHYLSPGRPGEVSAEVGTIRSGRRLGTASTTLRDPDGTAVLAALGSFSDLSHPSATDSPSRVDATPPDLPPPERCIGNDPGVAADLAGFMDRVDLRIHPDDAGFREGMPSGEPRVRGWFRFPDDEPIDTIGLLCVLDAFPPTVFNAALPVAWVPTLEFTAHIRRRPASGWLACEFTTRIVSDGFLEEDGLVWDCEGHPVAQSRQLALTPRA
ncbi:MAG: thioesterase family protein [Microthrixaceae bacterium]|nr:thioesterase family protein [Microthrixaceae bacterium]